MFIIGVGTAVPSTRYTQAQCWETMQQAEAFHRLTSRSRALLKKVFSGQNGVETRALSLDPLTEAFQLTPDALHARFTRHAPQLASAAARRAMDQARIQPQQIDALLISTCTGYLCPGLTSYVSEQLGLRPDVIALDLVGQGCGAALPNLRAAESLLASRTCERALCICVEVCSAAFYVDEDPGVLISTCLFGDAAGAVVVSREPADGVCRLKWKAAESLLSPTERDSLRFETRGGMLRNILTPPVPGMAARSSHQVLESVLKKAGIHREQITRWIWHAGGRDVLGALREEFGFCNGELNHSAAVLRELGNISSACVLHVLERTLAEPTPGYWWMSAFGAGFSCHGALLEAS
jgi:alkylresorcinol/alkylpyrone synthase